MCSRFPFAKVPMVNCRQVASPERNFDSLSFALISIPKAGSLYAVELPSALRRLFGLKYGLTTKFFENPHML